MGAGVGVGCLVAHFVCGESWIVGLGVDAKSGCVRLCGFRFDVEYDEQRKKETKNRSFKRGVLIYFLRQEP